MTSKKFAAYRCVTSPHATRHYHLRTLERETGVEPATSTLARSHFTTELLPPTRAQLLTSLAQKGL